MNRLFAALLLIALAAPASADKVKVGDLTIIHPWSRATPGQAPNGAVFMKIENEGQAEDKLLSASSGVAAMVEIHEHIMENDVAKMRPVDSIALPALSITELKPGGYHVMLMGLKEPLVEYGSFHLTLTFEKAGSIGVKVQVEEAGAAEPTH
ncbi:MAG: copper chaperone PCu(A)C [Dongiaceae bacterium]